MESNLIVNGDILDVHSFVLPVFSEVPIVNIA